MKWFSDGNRVVYHGPDEEDLNCGEYGVIHNSTNELNDYYDVVFESGIRKKVLSHYIRLDEELA